jgi:glucokinase
MFAGVDIGGTNIAAAVGSADGSILAERSIPTQSHEGPEAVLRRTAALVRELASGPVEGAGVGLPGTLDRTAGVVRFLPNLPTNWRGVPAGPLLSAELGAPVHLLNDARLATLGELDYGHGRDAADMVMFTLGTGIGGGVVLERRLRLGPIGAAGEVGHQTIVPDGPLCGCGNRGCLEALASGPAITGEAVRLMRSGMAPHLFELADGNADRVTPKLIGEASDAAIGVLIARAAGYLAIAAANVINLLHPQLIVLAGGVSALGERLLEPMRAEVRRRVGMFPADDVIMKRSMLGDRAGVLGGIALAARGGRI